MDTESRQNSSAVLAMPLGAQVPVAVIGGNWIEREAIARIVEARARSKGFAITLSVFDVFGLAAPLGAAGIVICVGDHAVPASWQDWHVISLDGHAASSGETSLASWRTNPQELLRTVETTAARLLPITSHRALAVRLTPRQEDVLGLLAEGQSNGQIAADLGMSENTVRIHVSAILKSLRVSNRTQAALWARQAACSPATSLRH